MANPAPISIDEARVRWVRTWRSGRQKGAWVYLDAALLREAGIDPAGDIEAMRYAQQDRRRRKDGSEAIRARVVLNLRMVQKQPEDGPFDPGPQNILAPLFGLRKEASP